MLAYVIIFVIYFAETDNRSKTNQGSALRYIYICSIGCRRPKEVEESRGSLEDAMHDHLLENGMSYPNSSKTKARICRFGSQEQSDPASRLTFLVAV